MHQLLPFQRHRVVRCLSFFLLSARVFLLTASPVQVAAGQETIPVADGVLRVGTIEHFAVSESSGLTASRRHPGVIWTHNDGGFQFLFALTEIGEYLGGFQVVGANLLDWEAVAADDQGNLYLADIGADSIARSHVAVHRVKEPNPARRFGNVEVTKTWLLRFPGPKPDCEAFFVFDGFGYLISKTNENGQVTMFRYPLSSRSRSTLLEEVTKISVTDSVTDATISTDGQRLGILTSDGPYVLFINGNPATADLAQREFTRYEGTSIEGGTFVEEGFLVSAESRELYLFTNSAFRCDAPAGFTTPLADRTVLAGAVVQLNPGAIGCPLPVFSWRFNGQLLAGQTNSSLVLSNVSAANTGHYEITASNVFAMATSAADLTVRLKSDLRITEVMPGPALSPGVPTADWWELTSFEAQPVDLSGWRFNDSIGGLADPYVFVSGPIINPDESIVFVEALTPEDFRAWWGDTNLPSGLQIITYSGSGLSFRVTGDTLFLWDDASTDPFDTVAHADFGAADLGVTFNYDPASQQFGARSELGVNGVIRAAAAPDIGSPGRIVAPSAGTNPLFVRLLVRCMPESDTIQIKFDAVKGYRYSLEGCDDLARGMWTPTGDSFQPTNNVSTLFGKHRAAPVRFYRLRVTEAQAAD